MPNLIGTNPEQVPTNGSLGTMAFQDAAAVVVDKLTAGAIGSTTPGTGAFTSVTANLPSTVNVNSASAALTVTQTGSGNSFVVEDQASDTTPFVIDANGVVILGHTASVPVWGFANALQTWGNFGYTTQGRFSDNAFGAFHTFVKSRSTTPGGFASVQSGDELGRIAFTGSDGSAYVGSAAITATVDGTPGTNSMPGRIAFSTTPSGSASPVERMRIDSAGNVLIGGDLQLGKTVTAAGATGAQTINKTVGTVNFAAAVMSLVVTNSLVTVNSIITATVATNDSTMKSVAVVAAAGSFTLFANSAATTETRVNFHVFN